MQSISASYKPKLIVRIKGGLGNQLFCYAAARSIAMANNLEVVIDDTTGFVRDRIYRRTYELDAFSIPCRKATPVERLEPFERPRRALAKLIARKRRFEERAYIEEPSNGFDSRLFRLAHLEARYLDGLWQDERYFSDIEQKLRSELQLKLPVSSENSALARKLSDKAAVALHVRWFMPSDAGADNKNLSVTYYNAAIKDIEAQLDSPHYFIFSDDLPAAIDKLKLPEGRFTPVSHNHGSDAGVLDFWLMSQATHFIAANSTFSWWAAWLGRPKGGMILIPNELPKMMGEKTIAN